MVVALRTVAVATGLAGTLDILSAFVFAGMNGVTPMRVLQSVASGPFGASIMEGGLAAALVGLAVHYGIMAVMVSVFVAAADRISWIADNPAASGVFYGLLLYGVMYWIVLPLRWPTVHPMTGLWDVSNALFSHIVCVGIPMAYAVRWASGPACPRAAS